MRPGHVTQEASQLDTGMSGRRVGDQAARRAGRGSGRDHDRTRARYPLAVCGRPVERAEQHTMCGAAVTANL
jgi:hypothetical protein